MIGAVSLGHGEILGVTPPSATDVAGALPVAVPQAAPQRPSSAGLSQANSLISTDLTLALQSSQQAQSQDGAPRQPGQLTEEEQARVEDLKARDREVRAHERAHASAAGSLGGAASFSYQRGPDGRQYAVGGEVAIDSSPVPGDPEATIRKMQTVIRAALAPAKPSGQDRAVAARAQADMAKARAEAASQKHGAEDRKNGAEPVSPATAPSTKADPLPILSLIA